MNIVEKKFSPRLALSLIKEGVNPVLAKVFAARGVKTKADAAQSLPYLLPYSLLTNAAAMASVLADAIQENKRLLIIADYDADGATACAIGVLALRAFGANVDYLIPNRLEEGYGLTPGIVRIACNQTPKPDYLVTVDNGISSHDGIDLANSLGVPVLVTDHHLAAATHPNAKLIVNPNQHGCGFPSKSLAGCGVMYYVMMALQDELITRDMPFANEKFNITQLLPIVAVGTVADVVALDSNNRILVNEGLQRIRKGEAQPGILALAKVAGKDASKLATSDIGFGIGPRINAAGRLESMNAGVNCLITSDAEEATRLAVGLNEINVRRREIELEMTNEAVAQLVTAVPPGKLTAVLHAPDWHQGVIGVVASRIKDAVWRPTFVMADSKDGEYKGSGRSIPALHLRDALDLVNTKFPGILAKFGGHAAAAGVTVNAGKLQAFIDAFESVVSELVTPMDLMQQLEVDGSLANGEMTLETVEEIKNQIWGQAFTEPLFHDTFQIVESRAIGNGLHLSLTLEKDRQKFRAVKFNYKGNPPFGRIRAAYRIDKNEYKETVNLQLLVEYFDVI